MLSTYSDLMKRVLFIILYLYCTSQAHAQSALKKIEEFLNYSDKIQQVWPGFIQHFHHGIYESNGTIFLAAELQKSENWKKKKVVNGIPIWEIKDTFLKEAPQLFFTNHELSNGFLVDVAFNDKNAISLLFHESFHAYQKQLTHPPTNWNQVSISDRVRLIKNKEFGILHNLLEKNPDALRQFKKNIIAYISIRKYRESLMDKNSVNLEREMEWQEGVATFVEHQIMKIIKKQSKTVGETLNQYGLKLIQKSTKNKLEQFMRWDSYYHGAAISYLLEQYKYQWKKEIENGKTPFELLSQKFPAIDLSDQDISEILGVKNTNVNKKIGQHPYDEHTKWKKSLQFTSDKNSLTFQSINVETFANGILAKSVQNFNFSDDDITISGRANAIFFEQAKDKRTSHKQIIIKLRKIPKNLKKCEKAEATSLQFICKAGTQLTFSGIKLKIKKDIKINLSKKMIQLHYIKQ